jgi:TonB-linked SusC/RagA family outer membrane protein
MQVSAAGFAQKITLSQDKASLKQIFAEIKKQTGYDVFYQAGKVKEDKIIKANFLNTPLEEVMEKCLEGQSLSFTIDEKTVLIKEKEPTFLERLADRWASIDVHGRVVDQEGQPLQGATVKVKGTGKSVSTNGKGEFYLGKVEGNAVLVVSFVGYVSKEVDAEKEMGDVVLEVSDNVLDQVQVIAYGETTRRFSTSNVSTIKAVDIEGQPVSNPLLALQGRVSGVIIEQASGMPGSPVKVRIQGQNSIGAGNLPLIVVDGIPYASQTYLGNPETILGNPNDAMNTLSWLNPKDVESIDVLKDADATSIYGSRAANGAILITTKKGRSGETRIDINLQNGLAQTSRKMKLLNTVQYLNLRRQAFINDGLPIPNSTFPINEKNESNYDLTVWDQNRYTDWQKELIGNKAIYSNYQLSAYGGSVNTQFRIAGNFNKETTVMPGANSDKKGALSFSLNNSSGNERLKISFIGNYLIDKNKLPGADLTSYATRLAPNAPLLYKPDGTFNWERISEGNDSTSTWQNPLAAYNNPIKMTTNNLVSSLNVSYELLTDLTLKTNIGYTNQQIREMVLFPQKNANPNDLNFINSTSSFGENNASSWIIEPQITYFLKIGKGKLQALLGSTISQNSTNYQKITGTEYNSDLLIEDIKSASKITINQNGKIFYKYAATFGRLNYNLLDRYLVSLNARRDGSSRFGTENQFHNFASIGGAWLFSNEPFIRDHLSFLSFGKLQGSYGITGNDQIGDYTFLNLYRSTSVSRLYQGKTGLVSTSLPNPFLQWEETRKKQISLELGFIKDKILLNASYFKNKSSNQLLGYDLPYTTGFNNILTNFPATIQNSGFELSLNSINFQNKTLRWVTSFNISFIKNRLLKFKELEASSYADRLVIGQPISGLFKVYKFLGMNSTTGAFEFVDKNGLVTSDPGFGRENRTEFINTNPNFFGGIQNNITYRRFEFSFFFQFIKQKAENPLYGLVLGDPVNQPIDVLDYWMKEGDVKNYQKPTTSDFGIIFSSFYRSLSDAGYIDASFIRLKNLSLSYKLAPNCLDKVNLKNVNVYFQGQNLFTITKYNAVDPETRSLNTLPPLRVFTLGVQIGL